MRPLDKYRKLPIIKRNQTRIYLEEDEYSVSGRFREQDKVKTCPDGIEEWTSELLGEKIAEYPTPEWSPLAGLMVS